MFRLLDACAPAWFWPFSLAVAPCVRQRSVCGPHSARIMPSPVVSTLDGRPRMLHRVGGGGPCLFVSNLHNRPGLQTPCESLSDRMGKCLIALTFGMAGQRAARALGGSAAQFERASPERELIQMCCMANVRCCNAFFRRTWLTPDGRGAVRRPVWTDAYRSAKRGAAGANERLRDRACPCKSGRVVNDSLLRHAPARLSLRSYPNGRRSPRSECDGER